MAIKKPALITEIMEDDFRKLNLTIWTHEWVETEESGFHKPVRQLKWVPHKINKILDEQIKCALDAGYEYNLTDLTTPVTIAIHINNISHTKTKKRIKSGYWDKFMNRFTPESTYEIGFGIKHLYSTRDYFEAHDDYWRVKKNETKVIYRVHLNPRDFILKHKTELIDAEKNVYANYDLVDGNWVLRNKTKITKTSGGTIYEAFND